MESSLISQAVILFKVLALIWLMLAIIFYYLPNVNPEFGETFENKIKSDTGFGKLYAIITVIAFILDLNLVYFIFAILFDSQFSLYDTLKNDIHFLVTTLFAVTFKAAALAFKIGVIHAFENKKIGDRLD